MSCVWGILLLPMLAMGQDLFIPMPPPPDPPPPPKAPELKSFMIRVMHRPQDPASVAAKNILRASFCKRFAIVPCDVNAKADESTLHLAGDLVVNAPFHVFHDVVTWVQQHRIARLNPPATVDLALNVHPNTDAGLSSDLGFSLWAGEQYPVSHDDKKNAHASSTKIPSLSGHSTLPAHSIETGYEEQDRWAYTCSYDAGGQGQWVDLCSQGPYALNTTCRSVADGAHIHLFYSSINSMEVTAKAEFASLATKALNLSLEICHDDYGHEQPHDATCWLGGPSHLSSRFPPGPPGGGSFTREHFSLYVTNEDFAKVAGWVMLHDTSEVLGHSLDFLLHPVFGCNFADHQMWSLYKGNTPNNMYGIQDEGGWSGKTPSRLDPFGPAAGVKCAKMSTSLAGYQIYLIYDPTNTDSVAAKQDLVQKLNNTFGDRGVHFVDDVPDSSATPNSPFLAGRVLFNAESAERNPGAAGFAKIFGWLSKERGSTDIFLVPQTTCGTAYDFIESSFWMGKRWPLNIAAFDGPSPQVPLQRRSFRGRGFGGAPVENDFILYVTYASANAYQVAAVEAFLSTFSFVMNVTRKECTQHQQDPEPSYNKLCMMSETPSPTAGDPLTVSFAAIYVPAASADFVLPWAASHRSAAQLGYQIDLLIVPLTGNALHDYGKGAIHAGIAWPLNTPALLASMQSGETRALSLPTGVHYYRLDNVDQQTELPNGVLIERWEVIRDFKADWPLQAPFVARYTIPVGTTFPSWSGGFWYAADSRATVITGNATFGNASTIFSYGDLFWAMAGHPQGPIANVGKVPLVVVTFSTTPLLARRAYDAPSDQNPSVDSNRATSRGYRQVEGSWYPNPSPHSDECMANGGVYNMGFDSDQYTEPVLRVKWAPNCSIPYHYHPTGALYLIQYGQMLFRGDLVGKDVPINQGEVRWVRPGFDYGPEYNSAAPMEITVLGTDSPPMFQAPPPGPYKYQKSVTITAVFDEIGGNIAEL